jgi:NADH-quinone oxidoreductase subunit G
MVNIKINGKALQVKEGTTILDAAKEAGYNIPTLCWMKDYSDIGACRVCVVEIDDNKTLAASCNTVVQEGMDIKTNSPRVVEARRENIKLMLSQHNVTCPTCERNINCALQDLANKYAVSSDNEIPKMLPINEWDTTLPLIREEDKCIKCYRCVQVCEKIQSIGVWDMVGTGANTTVGVKNNVPFNQSDCVLCGQCITHCPTNALHSRDDVMEIANLLDKEKNPDKVIVVQTAPSPRTAWGEDFGLDAEFATERRMAAALRRAGFDYVFDTNFSADLTIMEEGNEFLHRFTHKEDYAWPMFTSCCPGWVRFLKSQYPEMTDQLSTAKSPQGMFGAITKSYFAEKIGKAPEDIICISVMPCSAKKEELEIPNLNDAKEGIKDVDYSLTTREMNRLFKYLNIDIENLPEEGFDSPLGSGTGAAVIFGATGGVMEAALRTCYFVLTGDNPDADETFKAVRATGSDKPWVEAEYNVNGAIVRAAVVNSLGNTRKLLEALKAGEVEYDFVEVMACPGGCVGGGGQPIHFNEERAADRAKVIYNYDSNNKMRFSHENPDVQTLYDEFLKEPLGEKSHHLLHTDHQGWQMPFFK